jgi:hypothetical protein
LLQLLTEDEEATIMEEFDAENYLMNLGFTNPAWRIERNDLTIQLSNYFGRYFINKCKRNKNHFESLTCLGSYGREILSLVDDAGAGAVNLADLQLHDCRRPVLELRLCMKFRRLSKFHVG